MLSIKLLGKIKYALAKHATRQGISIDELPLVSYVLCATIAASAYTSYGRTLDYALELYGLYHNMSYGDSVRAKADLSRKINVGGGK